MGEVSVVIEEKGPYLQEASYAGMLMSTNQANIVVGVYARIECRELSYYSTADARVSHCNV
jgi:hypothetical protein